MKEYPKSRLNSHIIVIEPKKYLTMQNNCPHVTAFIREYAINKNGYANSKKKGGELYNHIKEENITMKIKILFYNPSTSDLLTDFGSFNELNWYVMKVSDFKQ